MGDNSTNLAESQLSGIESIELDTLLPVVQSAYSDQITSVDDWTCTQLSGGIGGGTIYRFSGHANSDTMDWSVILKVLRPAGEKADLAGWSYYRREADAYRSGWLDNLPGCLGAPRHLGITDFAGDACGLWLEDLRDSLGQWTMEDYGLAAYDIGQFNGAYLTSTPLLQQSWMSQNWIRNYVNMSAPGMQTLRNSLDHPLIKRWYPGNTSERLFQLWDQRDAYLNVMNQLPQTICHFDLFRRNMFLRNSASDCNRTVAIDWAFTGPGCVGADISPLVIATLAFFEVGLDKARELDQSVFTQYVAGLREAGWQGDERLARLGYLIANIRYSFAEIGGWLMGVFDDGVRSGIEQAFGHPLGEIFDYFAFMVNALSYQDDERTRLMTELGYA